MNYSFTRSGCIIRSFLPVFSGILLIFLVSCQKDLVVPDPGPNWVPVPRSLQVWLYHVDDTGKAQHFQNSYSGFELDVHYDTVFDTFLVKHDFNDTSTLTLSAWLNVLDAPQKLGFWLDFKNLASWNETAALDELLRIRKEFNLIQHPVIVESTNPSCLPPFDTLNFRVSYYIPYFDPELINDTEEQAYYQFIYEAIGPNRVTTISGYYLQHSFMQKWFPDMNKLLWYLDSYLPEIKDSIITETRKDPTVEVLLVTEDYLLDHPLNCNAMFSRIRK